MQKAFLNAFDPDADAMVRQLCGLITDAQLATIAAADYGSDQPEHLEKLQAIRSAGKVTTLAGWHPSEVLELIGHSEPDDPNWRPGGTGVDGWMMKAFCTAVLANGAVKLLGANADLPYHLGGLVRSILKLKEFDAFDFHAELTQFASWLILHELPREDAAFVGLALLTGALSRRPMISDDIIIEICDWISAAEVGLGQQSHVAGGSRWLLGNAWSFNATETWSPIGAHLARLQLTERSEDARNWVHTLGVALSA